MVTPGGPKTKLRVGLSGHPGPLAGGAAALALPTAGAARLAGGPTRPAHQWKTLLRNLAIMAIALGVVAALYSERSTTAKGLRYLQDLNWAWVAAASLVEALSMLAFALLYRDLLRANGARLRLTWILAASLSANAVSVAVPCGRVRDGQSPNVQMVPRGGRRPGRGQPGPYRGRGRVRRHLSHCGQCTRAAVG